MSARAGLFAYRKIYDLQGSRDLFLAAVRENLDFHRSNCPEYADILRRRGFADDAPRGEEELHLIPPIPTLYLKAHSLFSVPEKKLFVKGTTSGTGGRPALVGLDFASSLFALRMCARTFWFHGLISPAPTNYIVLGYQPSKRNRMGAVRTAYATTLAAPALHREYALKDTGSEYALNLDGIRDALLRYERSGRPVRFMGFPAYLLFLLQSMRQEGMRLRLHPGSRIFTAGGWKRFFYEKADKAELFALSEELLGIGADRCTDFFGAVEHPVLYCSCDRHRFHIPVYGRALIRDVDTLEPLGFGKPGILNLITPLVGSMPLLSVMTDDLAVLRPGEECGCGISSPTLEILGRTGLADIKTCAANAGELLGSRHSGDGP
jgi:phenylacetate-coenzyme A ligase PaaK-like adenylate-forming protein